MKWTAGALVAAVALAGCADTNIVTTTELSPNAKPLGRMIDADLVYGVARSVIRVEVTAGAPPAPKGGDNGSGGDGSADNSGADNSGADQTAPGDSAAPGQDPPAAPDKKAAQAKPKPGQKPKPKPAPAPPANPPTGGASDSLAGGSSGGAQDDLCASIRSDYNKNRFLFLRFRDRLDAYVKAHLDPLTSVSQAEADAITERLNEFKNQLPAAAEAGRAALNSYDLITAECPQKITVTLTHIIEADPNRLFGAKIAFDDFSNDQVNLKVDDSGLISKVDSTLDDQTATIVTSLGKSIGAAAFAAAGAPVAGAPVAPPPPLAPKLEIKAPQTPGEHRLALLRKLVAELNNGLPIDTPPAIDAHLPPAPVDYLLPYLMREPRDVGKSGIKLRADCPITSPLEPDPSSKTADPDASKAAPTTYDGIVASTPMPCVIKVLGAGGDELARLAFWALDPGSLVVMPVNRTVLVKRATTLDFAHGTLQSAQFSRPSPVAAGVALPGDFIGSLFSGITSSLTNRKSVVSDEADLVNARANLLKAETDYQAAVAAAKAKPSQ